MANKSHSSTGLRTKMPVSMRAKQFMPFHAQPGLDAALAAVEAEMESAVELHCNTPTVSGPSTFTQSPPISSS